MAQKPPSHPQRVPLQKQATSLFAPQEQVRTVEQLGSIGLFAPQVGGFAWHTHFASILLPTQAQKSLPG